MKLCPVCDNEMQGSFCIYGCTIEISRWELKNPDYVYPRNIRNCKICDCEFIPKNTQNIICPSKRCKKTASKEAAKKRPKVVYPSKNFSKNPTEEEILIQKEINEREGRYCKFFITNCKHCRCGFRTCDKQKQFCTKECEKKYTHNAYKREYLKKKNASQEQTCKDCKKKYKTACEDVGLCAQCKLYHKQVAKEQEKLEKNKERFLARGQYKRSSKKTRELNEKINWAAIEAYDPINKRFRVMRG